MSTQMGRGRAVADTAAGAAIQSMLYLAGLAMLKQKYQPEGRHASGIKCLELSNQAVATRGKPSRLQLASSL